MPQTDATRIAQTRIAQTRAARPSAATLAATPSIDSDHPAVRAFAAAHAVGADDRARAVALYGAVRDGVRYDPYRADLSPAGMTASTVLAQQQSADFMAEVALETAAPPAACPAPAPVKPA